MIKISAGQVLLILIDYYQLHIGQEKARKKPIHSLESKLESIKKLYFTGQKDAGDKSIDSFIQEAHSLSLLTPFQVADANDFEAINEDVTVRYFQTHLALETLRTSIVQLSMEDLQVHYTLLHGAFPSGTTRDMIDQVFNNEIIPPFHDEYTRCIHIEYVNAIKSKNQSLLDTLVAENLPEYCDTVKMIQDPNSYPGFSAIEKQKLVLLVQCAFLSIPILNCVFTDKPVGNIYKTDPHYSSEKRGRVDKGNSNRVNSHQLGLMRSYMPLSQTDSAYSNRPSSYTRPADRNNFNPNAEGPKKNFDARMHPYSCGIAGQVTSQLEIFLHYSKLNKLQFNTEKKAHDFFKCFFTMTLYNSGGHTFQEFFAALAVPALQDFKNQIGNFSSIHQEGLLYDNNEVAFEKALQNTIHYNHMILKKALLHEALSIHHQYFFHPKNISNQVKEDYVSYKIFGIY